jgi:hypothetical protein
MNSASGVTPIAGSPARGRHYSLTHLRDHVLCQELSACARHEGVATADLLARVAEFDERRLYSEATCSSMFDYCLRELHMSEDSALKRIRAGRTARAFPAIFPMLADGLLNLSGVLLLGPKLSAANASELLAAAVHKSNAEIEMMLAMRASDSGTPVNSGNKVAARPVVPSDLAPGEESTGPLSEALVGGPSGRSCSEASAGFALVVSEDDATATDQATGNVLGGSATIDEMLSVPRAAADLGGGPQVIAPLDATQATLAMSPTDLVATTPAAHGLPRYLRFTPVSAECASLRGMLSLEAMREFKRLQALVGKLGASADAAELLEKAIKAYADAIEKKKFGTGARTRPRKAAPNGRYIPAAIRKAVHERDGGRCTFLSSERKRCECRAGLQFDHVTPLGRGGETTVPNLRLLCPLCRMRHNGHYAASGFMPRWRSRVADLHVFSSRNAA